MVAKVQTQPWLHGVAMAQVPICPVVVLSKGFEGIGVQKQGKKVFTPLDGSSCDLRSSHVPRSLRNPTIWWFIFGPVSSIGFGLSLDPFHPYCGWTKSCTTLKSWLQPWLVGIYTGIIRFQVAERWCKFWISQPSAGFGISSPYSLVVLVFGARCIHRCVFVLGCFHSPTLAASAASGARRPRGDLGDPELQLLPLRAEVDPLEPGTRLSYSEADSEPWGRWHTVDGGEIQNSQHLRKPWLLMILL